MASNPVLDNISQAINFLTLPLILTQTADFVAAVQAVLRTTLPVLVPQRKGHWQIALALSPRRLPPRAILAACIACDFPWSDWMILLGNRDFDLIIEGHDVFVTYYDSARPYTVTIWSEPFPTPASRPLLARLRTQTSEFEPQVPISKLGQQPKRRPTPKPQPTGNSTGARCQRRTVAQQLLEENHKQEADEIFEMISKSTILAPTPTREFFPTPGLPTIATTFSTQSYAPQVPFASDSSSSRPSSRSSTSSSRFSLFSDDESLTSASSIASFECVALPSSISSPPLNKNSPAFIPRFAQHYAKPAIVDDMHEESSKIVVDADKKDKTKYLYRGGQTTVVTGGVMLGTAGPKPSPVSPTQRANTTTIPTHCVPVGGRHFSSAKCAAPRSTRSWRLAVPPRF